MLKRELAAAAVLALLIGISVWNLGRIDSLTEDIEVALCKSRTSVEHLDFRQAREHMKDAILLWMDAEKYTHCFISHTQINDASQALYELQQTIAQEDPVSCGPEYSQVRYLLQSIRDAERPSLGSIF